MVHYITHGSASGPNFRVFCEYLLLCSQHVEAVLRHNIVHQSYDKIILSLNFAVANIYVYTFYL